MSKDISTVDDVKLLVDSFYIKVRKNEVLGPIFNEVAKFDWDVHIPIMYKFWESILFGNAVYSGNPMTKHIDLATKTEMDALQFDTWLRCWFETIDEHFEGDKAVEAKSRSASIARLMMHKIQEYKSL